MSLDWIRLAALQEIPEGRLWAVACAGREWVVIRKDRSLVCFFDRCSHQDVRLSEFAQLDAGGGILCFAHGARFCQNSGRPLCFPGTHPLWSAEVKIEGTDVYIKVPVDLPED